MRVVRHPLVVENEGVIDLAGDWVVSLAGSVDRPGAWSAGSSWRCVGGCHGWWRVTRPGVVVSKPGGLVVVGVVVVSSSSVAGPGLWRWWRPGVGAGLAGRCGAGGGAARDVVPGCGAWRIVFDAAPRWRMSVAGSCSRFAGVGMGRCPWVSSARGSGRWPVVLAPCAVHRNPAAWVRCWWWLPIFPPRSASPRWNGSSRSRWASCRVGGARGVPAGSFRVSSWRVRVLTCGPGGGSVGSASPNRCFLLTAACGCCSRSTARYVLLNDGAFAQCTTTFVPASLKTSIPNTRLRHLHSHQTMNRIG